MADVPSDDGSWEDRLAGDRVFGHLLEHCRNVPAMFLPIEVGNWLMYCFTQVLVKYPNEKYQKLVKNVSFWLCKAYVRPI